MDSDAALVGWGTPLRANIDETVLLVVITEQGENRNQCEEQRNLFGSPTVLPAAERREAERSEADRSAAAGKKVAPEPPPPPAATGPGGCRQRQAPNLHRRVQTAHPG